MSSRRWKAIAAVGLALALAGCNAAARVSPLIEPPAASARPAGFSWTDWANSTNAQIRATVPTNADGEAYLALRVMLAAEVDAGRMSPEQMNYVSRRALAILDEKDQARRRAALNDISNGLIVAGAAMSAAAPAPRAPVQCNSVRLGNSIQTNCY